MIGCLVEIAEDARHLSVYRGFLRIENTQEKPHSVLKDIPFDQIEAVIAHAHGLSYTNNCLVALAERGIPFVLCNAQHTPVGMLLPCEGNFEQSRRMRAQIDTTPALRKKLWAQIVKVKLEQQASVLEAIGGAYQHLLAMSKRVKSGDPENFEAQGARYYWGELFGKDFRRDQQANGVNALLNYGYTVLRAAVARAVIAAGLHPSVGLFHHNAYNAMPLVDDLMEVFRAMTDLCVWHLAQQGKENVDADSKRALVSVLHTDMQTVNGVSPISVCAQKMASSLAQVFLKERQELELPLPNLPLALQRVL